MLLAASISRRTGATLLRSGSDRKRTDVGRPDCHAVSCKATRTGYIMEQKKTSKMKSFYGSPGLGECVKKSCQWQVFSKRAGATMLRSGSDRKRTDVVVRTAKAVCCIFATSNRTGNKKKTSVWSLFCGSPGPVRTDDLPVNSRLLHRWATEEYIVFTWKQTYNIIKQMQCQQYF